MMIDAVDLSIIRGVAENARMSWVQLAHQLDLSRQTVAERVQRLEEAGVIRGYMALINPEAVGADLTAFIGVTIDRSDACQPFLTAVAALPEVQECHHVAGDDSYLLKVRTRGTRGLEFLISKVLKGLPGVVRTRTTIVLSTTKETLIPPLTIAAAPIGDRP